MKKVLVDVNVVLDVLTNRPEHVEASAALLGLIESRNVVGYVAAHTVTTLHYLLMKHGGQAKAKRVLTDLLHLFRIVPVDEDRLRHALGLGWRDFEDAVQAACAEAAEVHYLVTRDKRGFKKAAVPTLSPAELVALVHPPNPTP